MAKVNPIREKTPFFASHIYYYIKLKIKKMVNKLSVVKHTSYLKIS